MIRQATEQDMQGIADVDRVGFSGNRPEGVAERWVKANFSQSDKYRYFVNELDGKIVGYIGWEIKGGFARKTPVVELQRLAVAEEARGKGIGTSLIEETIPLIKSWVKEINPAASMVRMFLWSKKDNEPALKIYQKFFDKELGQRNVYENEEIMLAAEQPL